MEALKRISPWHRDQRHRLPGASSQCFDHPPWFHYGGKPFHILSASVLGHTHSGSHHFPGLPCVFASTTKGPAFRKCFFKASQDNRALLLWLRSLAGLQTDGECNLSPQRPERCWDSGKTCCTPGPPRAPWCEWTCFSSCLCATDFADGSVCSFYLWSMQKFTAEAMNWDLCCLDTHKESWEKTINSIFLPRFFKTNPDPFIYCPKCIPCHFFFKWSPYLL